MPAPQLSSLPASDDDMPILVAMQPTPRYAMVVTTPDGTHSAITRRFEDGQASLCRLCPRGTCRAVEDVCQLLVPGRVKDEDAMFYSTVGMTRTR